MVKIMNTNIHTLLLMFPGLFWMYEFFNVTISWGKYHHHAHFEENEVSLNNLLQVMQSLLSGRTSVFSYYIMLRNEDTWMYVLALSLTQGAKTQRSTQYALDGQMWKPVSIKYYIMKATALSIAILSHGHPTCKVL